MPRYVVLHHVLPPESGRASHWDLMLEKADEASLRTWALEALPERIGAVAAEALADHRIDYLDYQGPVSNNRGTVTRWDQGTYRIVEESHGQLDLEFFEGKLAGRASLSRSLVAPSAAETAGETAPQRWVFRRGSP
jgi:hypothetical protein